MEQISGLSFDSDITSTSAAVPQGVEMVIESCEEWKIQEIMYDGVEKYIRPETYTDNVGRLARKIDWATIIGTDSGKLPPPNVECDDENVSKKNGPTEDLIVPEVGPWSVVAKHLHESLQQLNVLLDSLTIAKSTDYMKPLTVLDPVEPIDPIDDLVNSGKGAQWIWKRRAIQEAATVLDNASKQRQKAPGVMGLSNDYFEYSQRTQFFDELRVLRDTFRVRKHGERIYGDLSYNIFGNKFSNDTMFEIYRRSAKKTQELNLSSILEVQLPKDLMRRSMIAVTVIRDEIQSGDMYSSPTKNKKKSYLEIKEEETTNVNWKHSLKWAQNTLVLRDAFDVLCKDAIKMRHRLSVIRDNVLLISLFDDYLLRIELKHYPFEKGEIKEDGDLFLNRCLREMFIAFECTKFQRPQVFVPLPITHLPERLDMRGAGAFSAEEIELLAIKPKAMLEKLLDVAGHYHLMKMTNSVVGEISKKIIDPIAQHRWISCGRTKSRMVVYLSSKDFEPPVGNMRTAFYIDITSSEISVETKDGIKMDCLRDGAQVTYAIRYCMSCYAVNMVNAFAKNSWSTPYQNLYSNLHALDSEGHPAPSVILCNQAATKEILFIFHIGSIPEIRIRKFIVNDATAKPEEYEWRKVSYEKLVGTSLSKKVDVLLSFLKDV